ncbi:hypothetical protein EGW08_005025, partial [Elysia chlorotica]
MVAVSRRRDSMPSRSDMMEPSELSIMADIFSSFFRCSSISSGQKFPPSENSLREKSQHFRYLICSVWSRCCRNCRREARITDMNLSSSTVTWFCSLTS